MESLRFSQNIEFVENKGQWDDRVRFMGQISNGAFFIHPDGFTVLQNNAKDLGSTSFPPSRQADRQ